jgi:hypothetical protein
VAAIIERRVRSSELSRNSAEVFRAAEHGAVEITRRDGESLMLTRKSEADRQYEALEMAADLIAASLGRETKPFPERLQERFPWMHFLDDEERRQFADEVVEVARACSAVRDFGPLLVCLHEWHATARAIAAGYTRDEDLQWHEDPIEAPNPRSL